MTKKELASPKELPDENPLSYQPTEDKSQSLSHPHPSIELWDDELISEHNSIEAFEIGDVLFDESEAVQPYSFEISSRDSIEDFSSLELGPSAYQTSVTQHDTPDPRESAFSAEPDNAASFSLENDATIRELFSHLHQQSSIVNLDFIITQVWSTGPENLSLSESAPEEISPENIPERAVTRGDTPESATFSIAISSLLETDDVSDFEAMQTKYFTTASLDLQVEPDILSDSSSPHTDSSDHQQTAEEQVMQLSLGDLTAAEEPLAPLAIDLDVAIDVLLDAPPSLQQTTEIGQAEVDDPGPVIQELAAESPSTTESMIHTPEYQNPTIQAEIKDHSHPTDEPSISTVLQVPAIRQEQLHTPPAYQADERFANLDLQAPLTLDQLGLNLVNEVLLTHADPTRSRDNLPSKLAQDGPPRDQVHELSFEDTPQVLDRDMAAQTLEVACAYGSDQELESILAKFQSAASPSYLTIGIETRIKVTRRIWQHPRASILEQILLHSKVGPYIEAFERLYCIWRCIQSGAQQEAYTLFIAHAEQMWATQCKYAEEMKLNSSEFALVMAKCALQNRDIARARDLAELIPHHAPEFSQALDISLTTHFSDSSRAQNLYDQKLNVETDWRQRVFLLDHFLARFSSKSSHDPRDRLALNQTLTNPLRWLPESAEAWQKMTTVLTQYDPLLPILPMIFHVFTKHTAVFLDPELDQALWLPIKSKVFHNPQLGHYWKAVCLIHEFTWSSRGRDEVLWQAYSHHQAAEFVPLDSSHLVWDHLVKKLLEWIYHSTVIDKPIQDHYKSILHLISDTNEVSLTEIKHFLTDMTPLNALSLAALEQLVIRRSDDELYALFLERKAEGLYLTNSDLNQLWLTAGRLKRYDQCWRIATVLSHRKVLDVSLEKQLAMSGEKRSHFKILPLQAKQLKCVLDSFHGESRRLVDAISQVGPLIPKLLSSINPQLAQLKKVPLSGLIEEEVQEALDAMICLPQNKKFFAISHDAAGHKNHPFFSGRIDTKWSILFNHMAQRLGLPAWNWQLSLLHHQVERFLPRLTRGQESPSSTKIGRWLKTLSPHQRAAWYDLIKFSHIFDDEHTQFILGTLVGKLTIAMSQDHMLTMNSLELLQVPPPLRWSLEQWIISQKYGELRLSLDSSTIRHFPHETYEIPAFHPQHEV